ncbi:hypothetical protein [Nonomuraea dietziae]|uniref:hypothetical protein n=1 Tax=Nonomuraea dietziae TaxID=65515 RepID=UPI00343F332C
MSATYVVITLLAAAMAGLSAGSAHDGGAAAGSLANPSAANRSSDARRRPPYGERARAAEMGLSLQ